MPQIDPKHLQSEQQRKPLTPEQQEFLDARQMRTIDEPLPQLRAGTPYECNSCGDGVDAAKLIYPVVFPQFSDTPILCDRCILAFVRFGAIRVPMAGEDPESLEMAIENGGVAIGGTAFAWN